MHRLLLLGLNHTTAPLAVREKLALSGEAQPTALAALKQRFPGCEFVVLSTCNRVELYAAVRLHGDPRVDDILACLAEFRGAAAAEFRPHIYEKRSRSVIDHLFTVSSALDSIVLGESQILGQVRNAYDCACKVETVGTILNPLFQRAIAVGKAVMAGTQLGEGRLSVASVAVSYARGIYEDFGDKTVLSIGAGKMASAVLQNFAQLSPKKLLVCNRDPAKAQTLAGKFAGQAVPFEQLHDHLTAADIVISSTGSTLPIVSAGQFEVIQKRRRRRPIFLIDIAVPRDFEAGIGEIENVYLYNVDDLQQVVAKTLASRTDAIAAARAIVVQSVDEFLVWHRTREMGPIIDQLFKRAHNLAREEVARTVNKLPNVSADERQHLDDLARRIVNKLLHDPVTTLRQADSAHTPTGQYLHAMQKLFHLDEENGDVK